LGAVRTASLDVRQLVGVTQIQTYQMEEMTEIAGQPADKKDRNREAGASLPMPAMRPQKITVSASVQCAFAIK
jgi:hypothetical protein